MMRTICRRLAVTAVVSLVITTGPHAASVIAACTCTNLVRSVVSTGRSWNTTIGQSGSMQMVGVHKASYDCPTADPNTTDCRTCQKVVAYVGTSQMPPPATVVNTVCSCENS